MSTSTAESGQDLIPLLDDIVTPTNVKTAEENNRTHPATEGTDTMIETTPETTSKNPFLPHENLAKLAHERAEFQKQFKAFFENQQNQKPASAALKDTQDLDRIVHLATQKVLAEYMPQIEQRVRAEVIRQLGNRVTSTNEREDT